MNWSVTDEPVWTKSLYLLHLRYMTLKRSKVRALKRSGLKKCKSLLMGSRQNWIFNIQSNCFQVIYKLFWGRSLGKLRIKSFCRLLGADYFRLAFETIVWVALLLLLTHFLFKAPLSHLTVKNYHRICDTICGTMQFFQTVFSRHNTCAFFANFTVQQFQLKSIFTSTRAKTL